MSGKNKFLVLTGGVGGAKLCVGLQQILSPEECSFIVNVGDDFSHFGLHISPDIDSLTYALSGLSNPETGWGRVGETWRFIETVKELGGESWFNLGDTDLALHVVRSEALKRGQRLTEVTRSIANKLGIRHDILPVTDDPVPTMIDTDKGRFPFQEYFVKQRCEPAVHDFVYDGADKAQLTPEVRTCLDDPNLAGIIICPSNPYLSVDPVLAVGQFGGIIKDLAVPIVAVSPIVDGAAIKGPTAKIMAELDVPSTAPAVAAHYSDLIDGFVIDRNDQVLVKTVEELGLNTIVTDTVMLTLVIKTELATAVVDFVRCLGAE